MNVISSLVDLIRVYPEMRDSMEPMMKYHILPELKSPEAYLQMRAICFYGEFQSSQFVYRDQDHLHQLIDSMY